MAKTRQYIAVDLGAESGRVMLGTLAGKKLILEEIHRFTNGPIEQQGHIFWDFNRLLSEIKTGIGKAAKSAKGKVSGIAVDSWGADLGLLDTDGKLLENPYHYRDKRTVGMIEKACKIIGRRTIYQNTGIQLMPFNNFYQLFSMRVENSAVLAKAKHVLFTAELFAYHLCGQIYSEYSLASTSQLMNMKTGKWSKLIFDKADLPIEIMPKVVKAGTVVGKLTPQVAGEIGCDRIPVIAVGSHDTSSAVAAVPATGKETWAYISSGTWSLMGIESPKAIINDKTFKNQFTNEGGVENTIRLLKNIAGLWLVQECRRHWQSEGSEYSYGELAKMAQNAEPFIAQINPDNPDFYAPGNMPDRINDYLLKTGQIKIEDKGQMIRVILESLALKYLHVLKQLENITGKHIDCLHIVGGGIQNELLCQFAANAIGRKVITGPIEATASGNILMQAKAAGQVKSLKEIREIVRNSFELKEYLPQDTKLWQEQYKKIKKQKLF